MKEQSLPCIMVMYAVVSSKKRIENDRQGLMMVFI